MTNFIIVLIIALIVWAIYRYFIKPKAPKIDYSFGNAQLMNILSLIKSSKYDEAIQAMKQLNSDDLTQACDHIALSCDEKTLVNFYDKSSDRDLANLILGVYYGHAAWRARGNGYGNTVNDNQADLFIENLKKASGHLKKLDSDSYYGAEANSRMVRVCMGLGEQAEVEQYYNACREKDSNHLWNYIHYAEVIQPKWGGDVSAIKTFYDSLPNNELIKTVIRLKLLSDGYNAGENYFNTEMDMDTYSKELKSELLKYDSSGSISKLNSVHKYVALGYMMYIADGVGESQMFQKYWKLLKNRLALYPFGLQ